MAKQLFLNLPVKDLNKSVEFFTALGFSFNPDFTDENATSMIINDNAFVMLLVEGYFKTFTSKPVADARSATEAIVSFSVESREAVDELVRSALTAGGTPSEEAQDYGFMYTHSFQDPDGHLWEVFWMDPAGAPQDPVA
ncbi:putative lactoylglutathione lyase [Arthrobacter sp. PvP023]|uniref:VOC family protein n=1 Tax=Micrococcaceae TaxID=1268 RepID=UPI001AEB3450|nr:VOC family protein [Arthrobacter sp. PvP023]MBP1136750.1 putative lactoylglutathione lyase [Arthrobacter sp. PvP023]